MTMIITLVGIIVFLVFALVAYGALDLKNESNHIVCHNSVIERATFNFGPIEAGKKLIPLQCKTEKICVTQSGEDCKAYPEPTKENPVTKETVSEDEARTVVLDRIADAMYQCHKDLGEGLVNFMPTSTFSENYCLICSRVAVDEELRQNVPSIGYGELYRYLEQKKNDDGKSYLSFIHPGWKNWAASIDFFEEMKKKDSKLKDIKFDDWKIDFSEEKGYAVIAQITPEGAIESYISGAVVLTGVALIGTGIGSPVGAIILGAGASGATLWYTHPSQDGKNYNYSPPSLIKYDIQSLRDLKCTSFETAQ